MSWGLAALGYIGGLFYLSSLPGSATGPNTPFWRFVSNAAHIPLFAGFGLCLLMLFAQWTWRWRAIATLGIGLAYSLFDEWHQNWSCDRSVSFGDVTLDMIGISLALSLFWALDRWRTVAPLTLSPTGGEDKAEGRGQR